MGDRLRAVPWGYYGGKRTQKEANLDASGRIICKTADRKMV